MDIDGLDVNRNLKNLAYQNFHRGGHEDSTFAWRQQDLVKGDRCYNLERYRLTLCNPPHLSKSKNVDVGVLFLLHAYIATK